MAETTLATVTRPNGKPYRPRKIVTRRWENVGGYDEDCGAVVLGTHDIEAARQEADRAIKFWFDHDMVATKPEVSWFRLGYANGEPMWLRDEVKGRAGVMFTADYPVEGDKP